MGMDISGKSPKNEQGEYFRANVWSWRPLHQLLIKAGVGQAKDPLWSSNDGAGLETQAECDEAADKLERYLKTHPETEFVVPLNERTKDMGVDHNGQFGKGNLSPWRTDITHVREFITFLRSCGGFEIW